MSLLSPIRTITVGPGITPDLLTFCLSSHEKTQALAGFHDDEKGFITYSVVYRRWGLAPRPENKQVNYNANEWTEQCTRRAIKSMQIGL